MAHSFCIEPDTLIDLTERECARLLRVARESITTGLATGQPLQPDDALLSGPLGTHISCFVTLTRQAKLRGCVGSLQHTRPLVCDVATNACHAAISDARFKPVREHELAGLTIEISVLSPPTPIECKSEADLLAQLVPGADGLVLTDRSHHATFLPKVWERLAEPQQFLRELKRKAGLSANHWSTTLRIARYRTISFGE